MGAHFDKKHKNPARIPHGPADHARNSHRTLYPGMFISGGGVNTDPDNDGDNDTAGGTDTDNDKTGS